MKEGHNTQVIWNEFSAQIRGYLLSKVKQKDDAEDLLQEIFIKIHSSLGDLKDEKKLAPWTYQIVRNSLTDYYRKNRVPEQELDENGKYLKDDHELTDIKGLVKCLNVFISRLPEKYREPLVLSDIKGLKQKDVAEQMNLSYSGLKSRVQRGREMIKEMFMNCCCYQHNVDGKLISDNFDHESCEICNPPAN